MGKKKKKQRKLPDKVAVRKQATKAETNPFEIHLNRVKHHVIGRKLKNDRGLPGVAREKALKKRKDTLLHEYKNRFKANKFRDRRIGEYNTEMSVDDKMTARFTMERKKKKKSLFNLNEEEEELTHYGQSLADIEKFEDPQSDDDEDENQIAGEFMKENHFGGLLTLKESSVGDADKPKSRKEWIEELIVLSKQKKHERQTEKEDTFELTQKLDSEWKDIRALLSTDKKKPAEKFSEPKSDSYDALVRSLQFEGRAKATDRLKTPEEQALEEKEKLEKLEEERLKRMNDTSDLSDKPKLVTTHMSADDLDDNFHLGRKTGEKKVRFLEYKDGKLVVSDDDDDDEDMKADEDLNGNLNDDDSNVHENDVDEAEKDEEDSEDDENSEDSFSDLKSDDDNDLEEFNMEESEQAIMMEPILPNDSKPSGKDIPYVFTAPEKYEDFLQIIDGHSSEAVIIIVERIIKCHHFSLAEGNKRKLEILFAILLQYVNDKMNQDSLDFEVVDKLVPHLFSLALVSPKNAAQCMKEVILEKYNEFEQTCHTYLSGTRAQFPGPDTLIFFKLISVLFPTSDFHHPVVTPTTLFMGQILSQCRIKTSNEIVKGLFVSNLLLEYVTFSKRLVPEAINFLGGLLSLAVGNDLTKPTAVTHPFRMIDEPLLKLEGDCSNEKISCINFKLLKQEFPITDNFRVAILHRTCQILLKFAQIYDELPSFREIFFPVQLWWKQLSVGNYPKELQVVLETLDSLMDKPRSLVPLKPPKKRPPMLPLLNPKIEENFSIERRKRKGGSQSQNEKQRLIHKIKREMKGATREIKRDNQFLAKQKLDEQIQRDAERKTKVKLLYQSLASQEGDFKSLERQKRKKKR